MHGLLLADDAFRQLVLHLEQFVALAFQHFIDRHARPARDDLRHMVGGDRLLHKGAALVGLGQHELLFKIGNDAIGQAPGLRIVAFALGVGELRAGLFELLLDLLGLTQLVLLGAPAGGEGRRLFFEIDQLAVQLAETVARGGVRLLLQRFALDLQLDDAPVEFIERFGFGIHLHAQTRARLVHEVDGLVRQEAVGDVAIGKRRRRHDGGVGDAHAVVHFVFLFQPAQDRDRVFDRGLGNEHRLEPPRQRRVLLHMLAIFIEGGGADAMQLAARQRGLQQVGGVHGALALACAHQRMHLVDEEDDAALR